VPWHDRQVTTVLQYLVIAGVIGLVVFALATFVFGRGEQLAPLSPRVSPTELPEQGMSAEDVRRVRFAMALRGYRMSDVDWALDRMADELERLRGKVAALSGEPLSGAAPAEGQSPAAPHDDLVAARTDEDDPQPQGTTGDTGTGSVLTRAARARAGRHVRSDYEEGRGEGP
jgi:DivIVA domain-containing protein